MFALSQRDYQTILSINRELINNLVDIQIIIYKVNEASTKTNSYGEAPKKTWRVGIQIPCLYERKETETTDENLTINVTQQVRFSLLRAECEARGIYPEAGDVVEFDNNYYEIDNTNENILFGGRVEYNHAISCDCHLSRNTQWQLERPQL